jgi:hypothetical protein
MKLSAFRYAHSLQQSGWFNERVFTYASGKVHSRNLAFRFATVRTTMIFAKSTSKSDLKPCEKQVRVRIAVVSCGVDRCASALMRRSENFDQRFDCSPKADLLPTLTAWQQSLNFLKAPSGRPSRELTLIAQSAASSVARTNFPFGTIQQSLWRPMNGYTANNPK